MMEQEKEYTVNEGLAREIEAAALAHGFSSCGIISLDDLDGFAERFEKRLRDVPESAPFYEHFRTLTMVKERLPWAKSTIICTSGYRKYRYPKELQRKFAKAFLLSRESDPDLRREKRGFTEWLTERGIRWTDRDEELRMSFTGYRYAAAMAGLGIVRKNNFFYDENGSYTTLDAYAIDAECRLYQHKEFHPCAEKCHFCQDACPTHALKGPRMMNPLRCVSFCTTFGNGRYPDDVTDEQLGTWTIGCDACQDACPYNRGKNWDDGEPYPHLDEYVPHFDLPHLVNASDEEIAKYIVPKTEHHVSPKQGAMVRASAKRALKNEKKGNK